MRRLVLASILGVTVACQHGPSLRVADGVDRLPSSEAKAVIHGLSHLDLELLSQWTHALYEGTASAPFPGPFVDRVMSAFGDSSDVSDFMHRLMLLNLHQRYDKADDYKKVADGLLASRKHLREQLGKNEQRVREGMQLLELLAEEVLYVQYLRFPERSLVRFDYTHPMSNACIVNGIRRGGILNGIPLCQGDILLSKGSAASSSFLSRIADIPGNFSHSTIPFYSQGSERAYLIEAEIEDGVKLRDPEAWYTADHKAKLFVYRSTDRATVQKAVGAVDALVVEIRKKVGRGDPTQVAAFDYDFAMNADDPKKLFCSEVAYYAYGKNGMTPARNPYAKTVWSRVTDPGRRQFLTQFLNTSSRFPAPSDVELHPDYDIVAMQFDLSKMAMDRYMVALIDTLFVVMKENEASVARDIDQLGQLGSSVVDPTLIRSKIASLAAFGVKLPAHVDAMIDKVPKNINYKQLLFFSFLNDGVGPKVAKQLSELESQAKARGHVVDVVTMRQTIYSGIKKELAAFLKQVTQLMR